LFATVRQPVGVAPVKGKLLVTSLCADKVFSIDQSGVVSTFATLPPTHNACLERYIAASSGRGGFLANFAYVVQGQTIYSISPTGVVSGFATISSLPNASTGITFDRVGTFGFKMLVTDRRGPVWTVDSTGAPLQIADVGSQIEGPVVAPLSFQPVGGQLLVGSEFSGLVYAVSPTGVLTSIASWNTAEGVSVVPPKVCNLGTSNASYFVASDTTNAITGFPATDFTGLSGDGLVPSQTDTTIGLLTPGPGGVTTSTFQAALGGELEGSTFARC
jgi:hypothetical protein